MTTALPSPPAVNSPLGYGLSCTYCVVTLPIPQMAGPPVFLPIAAVQPPLGVGLSARGVVLPDVVSGRPLLAEAIVRRLSTSRGTLPDTAIPTTVGNYGLDILDYVYADMTTEGAGMLAALIDAQISQEERVVSSSTTVVLVGAPLSTLLISINLVDGAGPFKLTLSIDVLNADLTVLSSPTS